MDNRNDDAKRKYLPFTALGLDLSAAALFFLGTTLIFSGSSFLSFCGMLCYMLTVAAPVGGIVTGVTYLFCDKEAPRSKPGIFLSVLAILLPIATVIVLIVLFGTGVAVISLM